METVTGVRGVLLSTLGEPVTNSEWRDARRDAKDEAFSVSWDGVYWISFVLARKPHATELVNELGRRVEKVIGNNYVLRTHSDSQFCTIAICVQEWMLTEASAKRLWMACLHASASMADAGASLFSCERFLAYNRTAAEAALAQLGLYFPESGSDAKRPV